MKLEDSFQLQAPVERVWEVLNDVELISPYVPGFALEEIDGDVFHGVMRVKLGAVTVQYDAQIAIAERDEKALSVVLDVSGKERRGSGKMKAKVTSRLQAEGDSATAVSLETDLQLAGKVAQMGRGMIADVSSKLTSDFVLALDANVLSQSADAADSNGAASPSPGSAPQAASQAVPPDGDAVDLTGAAGAALARRLGPPSLALLVLLTLAWLVWRR